MTTAQNFGAMESRWQIDTTPPVYWIAVCPNCGSDDVRVENFVATGRVAHVDCECDACGLFESSMPGRF